MAGYCGNPGLVDYTASKFGAVGFTESLRIELQVKGYSIFHSKNKVIF